MNHSKNHLIGGITGGVGSALAVALKSEGHQVAGYARDADRLGEFARQTGCHTLSCDATDPNCVTQTIESLHKELGSIDGYTHAIGSIFLKPAHLTSDEDWLRTIEVNLHSAFYALRAVSKIMSKQGHGSCLFFSTAAAQTGSQSDVSGVNTTSSSVSIAPAGTSVSTQALTATTQSLTSGTFTVAGTAAPAAVQTALADIFAGNLDTPAVTAFTGALGSAGTLVAEQLSVFGQTPSADVYNAAVEAFNSLVDGAGGDVFASAEFLTTFEVMVTLRAAFN